MSTVNDYYAARADIAPLASGDEDIEEDIDFSLYADSAAFLAANTGWAVNGSPVWSANGVSFISASSLRKATTGYSSAAMVNEGSIHFEVERLGVTVNEPDASTTYIQSEGRTIDANIEKYICVWTADYAASRIQLAKNRTTNGSGLNLNLKTSLTNPYNIGPFLNSSARTNMTQDEIDFAKITLTWKGSTIQMIVDGVPVVTDTLVNATTGAPELLSSVTFDTLLLGNSSPTGTTSFFDTYSIRRMQVTKRHSLLVANPTRIAVMGDSIMKGFVNASDFSSFADIAAIPATTGGLVQSIEEFIRLFAVNHNFVLTNIHGGVTACENGSHWRQDIASNPIDATQWNDVIAYNPEILITAGSPNDVSLTNRDYAGMYDDVKTILDTIIDGCRSLREIHFFSQWGTHQDNFSVSGGGTSEGPESVQVQLEQNKFYTAAQSAINGYTRNNAADEVVKVYFHDTYELWGGDNYPVSQNKTSQVGNVSSLTGSGTTVTVVCDEPHSLTTGAGLLFFNTGTIHDGYVKRSITVTNPTTFTFSSASVESSSTGTWQKPDLHPGTVGSIKMAEIIYNAIKSSLTHPPMVNKL